MSKSKAMTKSDYSLFDPNSGMEAALRANVFADEGMTAADLLRVKIPSAGSTTWMVPDAMGKEKSQETIEGIFVYYGRGGVVWPNSDPKPGTMPILRTDDLQTAYQVGEDWGDLDRKAIEKYKGEDGLYNWQGLVGQNGPIGWGTGRNGSGRRGKEYRILCVLPKDSMFPYFIRAQPGSLKTVVPFVKRITILGVPYYQTIISLGLQKVASKAGMDYSQIVPTVVSQISSERAAKIKELFTDPFSASINNVDMSMDEYDDEL